MFVQPIVLVQNGGTWFFQRWNTVEKIPEALEMVFHLTAASHDVSSHRIKNTVACTACNVHRFQDVNVVARHLCVSYKEASCCQRSKSASYQICMLVIYAFRFLWAGKCFVVTVCIINALAVFLIFAALCIAVIRVYVCFCNLFLLTAFICQDCCSCTCCGKCCHT